MNMDMKNSASILGIFLLLLLTGCSDSSTEDSVSVVNKEMTAEAKQRQRSNYLAYEHRISVDLPKNKIQLTYQQVIDLCADDEKYQCTILHTSLNTGDYASANIKLRIKPNGVSYIIDLVSAQGKVSNQSTDVQDLGDAIVDSEKRLDMLKSYQKRLEDLEEKSENDAESLIKLASEISSVQANLEYAEGKKAELLQRVQMDIVHISLFSREYVSFWQPISDALDDFGNNLSEGVSQAITAMAFLLPWIVIVIFFVYVIRIVWRKGRAKSQKS